MVVLGCYILSYLECEEEVEEEEEEREKTDELLN